MGHRIEEWLEAYPRGTRTIYRSAVRHFGEYFGKDPDLLIEERMRLWNDRARLKANDRFIYGFSERLQARKRMALKTALTYYAAVRSFCRWHGVQLGRSRTRVEAIPEYEKGIFQLDESWREWLMQPEGGGIKP